MPKLKMPISQRAKIFMPFDALKGFKDALKEKEKVKVDKKILSEDQVSVLNEDLYKIKKGDLIEVIYYDNINHNYLKMIGVLTEKNETFKYIVIIKSKILFDDLISVKIVEEQVFD